VRRGEPMPRLWLAGGAVGDPRGLLRFGMPEQVLVPVGPVQTHAQGIGDVTGGESSAGQDGIVHGTGPGGVEHGSAPGVDVAGAVDRLRWCAARGRSAVLLLRGTSAGEMASLAGRVCSSLEGDAVGAVEVDLRGADDQAALKVMARLRESTPRDLLLLARLSALQPDLVAVARGAVAGGAGAVVVCGSLRLGPDRWWSGASTAAACRAGLRTLTEAARDHRWPAVPLVGAGGVHDVASARAHLDSGASAVQVGTALWADPTLLPSLLAGLDQHPGHPLPAPDHRHTPTQE
jgi:dihydroorotate dehydrogenase (NAD+) catalytic subunit